MGLTTNAINASHCICKSILVNQRRVNGAGSVNHGVITVPLLIFKVSGLKSWHCMHEWTWTPYGHMPRDDSVMTGVSTTLTTIGLLGWCVVAWWDVNSVRRTHWSRTVACHLPAVNRARTRAAHTAGYVPSAVVRLYRGSVCGVSLAYGTLA